MSHKLDLKIRQMHHALGQLTDADLSQLRAEFTQTDSYRRSMMDFNQKIPEAELANAASLLVASIASIKDHLKVWCNNHGVKFEGDNLINSDRDVAIIHDLWNIDKHSELDKKPRSGHTPRLVDLAQRLRLTAGGAGPSSVFVGFNLSTGTLSKEITGGGNAVLIIDAVVVDESDAKLGEFADISERAASAWEAELTKAGVPVPAR